MKGLFSVAIPLIASLAVCGLVFVSSAQAVEIKDLTTIEVSVNDESDLQRNGGIRRGLSHCLVRLSGHSSILQNREILAVLDKANHYLLQYSYDSPPVQSKEDNAVEEYAFEEDYGFNTVLTNNTEEADETKTLDAKPQNTQKILKLKFDKNALLKVLNQANLPVWGSNRPALLVWWISEEDGVKTTHLAEGESRSQLAQSYYARMRGVPLKLPAMDWKDKKNVSADDIWALSSDSIAVASKRYGAQVTLVGKSYYRDTKWHALWEVDLQGVKKRYEASSEELYPLNKLVINTVASILANEYAVAGTESGRKVVLSVSDIKSAKDYAKLSDYLKKLVAVSDAKVLEVDGTTVHYELSLKEGLEKLHKLIKLDGKMERTLSLDAIVFDEPNLLDPVSSETENLVNTYQYRWLAR